MDPQTVFCPNPECPARGQVGEGNVGIYSQKERRYRCRVCGKTFAARVGTAFYRLRTEKETVTLVIPALACGASVTLLAPGCPLQAIVAAFGFDERTVADWHARGGAQGRKVHEQLVAQPRDLGQVKADELWAKLQGLKAMDGHGGVGRHPFVAGRGGLTPARSGVDRDPGGPDPRLRPDAAFAMSRAE